MGRSPGVSKGWLEVSPWSLYFPHWLGHCTQCPAMTTACTVRVGGIISISLALNLLGVGFKDRLTCECKSNNAKALWYKCIIIKKSSLKVLHKGIYMILLELHSACSCEVLLSILSDTSRRRWRALDTLTRKVQGAMQVYRPKSTSRDQRFVRNATFQVAASS